MGPRHDACTDDAVMGRRVRLGTAFGIEIAVDAGCVFALILATWTLVTLAGHARPASPPAAVTVMGAGAAIGVFASLAVHELVHALAVRSCGVPVRRVTLFVVGGITDVERDPSSPRSETLAAIVAPLSTALLGAALLGIAAALGDRSPALGLAARWLGDVNLAIAAVNIVPAFPLDGGRLVRAAMWRATGDNERATRWAAWATQAMGWTIVGGGVVLAFTSHGDRIATAVWIAFGGWFLTSAAAQAYAGIATSNDDVGLRQHAVES